MKKLEFNLRELCLEITDSCLLECQHCSGSCNSKHQNMLSSQNIKNVISDFSDLGGRKLEISGGEPLLHSDLPSIIQYANECGLETILYSSGNRLNDFGEIVSIETDIASQLQVAGLKKVVFGLHGPTSSVHDTITRKQHSFENTLASIQVMKKLGFWIGIHFVPIKPNFGRFFELCQLSRNMQVDEVGILRFVPQGRGQENRKDLEMTPNEFACFNLLLNEISAWASPTVRVGRPMDFRFLTDPTARKTICDAGKNRCLITPDGRVKPCPAFKRTDNDKYVAGNIKEKPLKEIWNDPKSWSELRSFNCDKIEDPCRDCQSLQKCKGGCAAQRLLKFGDLYSGPDPCCFKLVTPKTAPNPSKRQPIEQLAEQLLLAQA